MTEKKELRLSKLAREFNVGITTIVDFLKKKGHDIESNPNTKVAPELYELLTKEYSSDINAKKESEKVNLRTLRDKKETISIEENLHEVSEEEEDVKNEILIKDTNTGKKSPLIFEPKRENKEPEVKIIGKIDIDDLRKTKKAETVSSPSAVMPKEEKQEPPVKPEPQVPLEPAKKVEPIVKPEPIEIVEPISKAEPVVVPEVIVKSEPLAEVKEEIPVVEEIKKVAKPHHIKEVKEVEVVKEKVEVPEVIAEVPRSYVEPDAELSDMDGLTSRGEMESDIKVVGRIDLDALNQRTRPPKKTKAQREVERRGRQQQARTVDSKTDGATAEDTDEDVDASTPQDDGVIRAGVKRLTGPTVVGRIELPSDKKPIATSDDNDHRKKRKRIKKDKEKVSIVEKPKTVGGATGTGLARKPDFVKRDKDKENKDKPKVKSTRRPMLRTEVSEEDVQKQIKDTLARLTSKGKSKTSKYRREKREVYSQRLQDEMDQQEREKNILKVTEFVSVNELASMMDVPVTQVIATCMNMGLFVSINQRLDAETMALVADEFDFKVEFVSVELQEALSHEDEPDKPEDMLTRPPIVVVMGHVDHGKTKLLDYIRNANVIAGEAGGITQHIGAYGVKLKGGRQITFLDTPGHEAFTAMRARGAKITDIAIIVVAADDGVMPQTKEAINHASAANVPIVFAINKVDKKEANPEKIKEELAQLNYLVEDWGGKYQSQEISAKSGLNIELLLEKVLLEAEMLDLKANPGRKASGTVIESTLDKGRGYVATILVETGTLRQGDVVLAGNYYGHVKAMYNERNQKVTTAGPASPVLILGLDGAPQSGDTFNVMSDIREAKDIATKRGQLMREQGIRTKKHITLDEIGRRIAIGNFQELNVIVKGDVDGSVEALSDSLIKLSTPEIQVNVIHKAVGQISESDVLLAAASNAIIIGFQVRPSVNARKLAEKEQIDIRLYSIIYDAIEELKAAMEGMLSPEIKEEIVATIEVREVFKITKVGTVAGCFVREGKITRNTKIRVIRDGIVIHSGSLGSLKRFKDDVKEVTSGYECGLNINKFEDMMEGDIIEGYQETEVKKKL